jgi:hypothetical protein
MAGAREIVWPGAVKRTPRSWAAAVQLESLRQGNWGTASLWGRVVTYKG